MAYNPKRRSSGVAVAPVDVPGHAAKVALMALERIAQSDHEDVHARISAASAILAHVRVEDCDW